MSTRPIRALFEAPPRGSYYDAGPSGSRVLLGALAGAVVLAELILAAAVVRPGAGILLAPLAGAAGLALTFAFPFAAACVFLALIDTVLYSTYFGVSVGVSVSLPELLLGALLVVSILRPRRDTWGGVAGGALAVYLLLIVAGSVLSVSSGRVDAQTSRDFTLPFCYLLFFYVALRLFPEPERMRRLLWAAVLMAGVTGVVALYLSAAGNVNSPLQDPSAATISSDDNVGRFLRVRLPGVALAYGLFWYAVVTRGRVGKHRLWWTLAIFGSALSIAISLNRNMWIGLIFGFGVLIIIGGARTRRNLLASTVALFATVALIFLVGLQKAGPSSAINPIVKRGATLLAPGHELQDQSLQDRGAETTAAWHALNGHWLLGLGIGAPFGVTFRDDLGGGRFTISSQTFLHNQYLYIVLCGGVGALLAFLTFLGTLIRAAWRARARDPAMPALITGLSMIMLSGFVMIAFVNESFMVLISLLGAAILTFAHAAENGEPAPE